MRILSSEATEDPAFSAHRLRVKILRDDVEHGAVALIFALAVLSFHDARPRGSSEIDYVERDEWTLGDLCQHLRFRKGALSLDTDYVRGRMMKTQVIVWPTGVLEIETTNRHQMATRWIETLKGAHNFNWMASTEAAGAEFRSSSVISSSRIVSR